MFSIDELGLIAYLNDNPLSGTNRDMTELPSDTVDRVLERYLSRGNGTGQATDDAVVELLNVRSIKRDALARTTGRVRDYMENGITIATYWDTTYPGNLRLISDPPLVLYVNGKTFPGIDQVAIVGTSHPSEEGLDLAYEYGARIARKGRTVVSGLAKGIDSQAIEGALGAGGEPIAVLGTPLSDIYPEESKALASEVAQRGAVVSELTEEAYLHPGRFLQRNRVIGGMSGSVVIVESSGVGAMSHLIELMLRQGRKAYVIDQGEFEDPDHEAGFKKLRGMGAVPITHPDEMMSQETRQGKLF